MRYGIVTLAFLGAITASPVQDEAVREFERGNHMFTAAIYRELIHGNRGNLVVSPFSVETILSLTYEGAKGPTAEELVRGLRLPDSDEKVQAAYKEILPNLLNSADDFNVITANKIYLRKDAILEERFGSIARSIYRSDVENVDFSSNIAAADEINKWVEAETNNRIRNLIDPSNIDESTTMVLVNTLYLSGKWVTPFMSSPQSSDFYRTRADSVPVSTMVLQQYLNYWDNEELDAQFLEIPLQGANVSMVIALPREIDGLRRLEERIEEVLQPQSYKNVLVDVELPKFNIQSKVQLLPILQNLGILRVFSSRADLSGISSTDKDFYISNVLQKSVISITESGIESAAATEVSIIKTSAEEPTLFRANRPFLYYVRNNGVVLFSGRYVDPEEQQ